MKLRFSLLSLVSLLAFAPAVSLQAAEKATSAEEHTELGERMDKLNSAHRKLRSALRDPAKNAESIEHVAVILEAAKESAKYTPEKAADLPEADRAKFVADYQARMEEFIAEVEKLQAALQANNHAEATKLYAALGAMRKKGHEEFQKKKDKE